LGTFPSGTTFPYLLVGRTSGGSFIWSSGGVAAHRRHPVGVAVEGKLYGGVVSEVLAYFGCVRERVVL
jgi:hypothetical protein